MALFSSVVDRSRALADRVQALAASVVHTDAEVALVYTAAALAASERVMGKPMGAGHLAATALRHPWLRDALDEDMRARAMEDLYRAGRADPRPVLFLPGMATRMRSRGADRASLGDLLAALQEELPQLLRGPLSSFDLRRADAPYRASLEPSRVVVPGGNDGAAQVEVHALNDDETRMDFVVELLRDRFLLDQPAAQFAMLATDRHGSAQVATLARAPAEERIAAAELCAQRRGYPLSFRMLRVRP